MVKKRKGLDPRGQKILCIVCLSFLGGVVGGAIGANLMGDPSGEMTALINQTYTTEEKITFFSVFWKYFKYDLLIWLGGWLQMGLFLSGAAFLLRGISLGFTSGMLAVTYGGKGIGSALLTLLPQNFILIPTYLFIMCVMIYFFSSQQEGNGKRELKRDRRKRQTEYCILFAVSVSMVALGAGIEILFYPL